LCHSRKTKTFFRQNIVVFKFIVIIADDSIIFQNQIMNNYNANGIPPLLPTGYIIPAGGGKFSKFAVGQNRFRILQPALLTWAIWSDDGGGNKTVVHYPFNPMQKPQGREVNHNWNLLVFDYQMNDVSLLQVSQKSIQEQISGITQLPGFADYRTYDIVVNRTGTTKTNTDYHCQALMPELMTPDQWQIVSATLPTVDLSALLRGADVFNPTGSTQQQGQQDAPQFVPQQTAPLQYPAQQTVQPQQPVQPQQTYPAQQPVQPVQPQQTYPAQQPVQPQQPQQPQQQFADPNQIQPGAAATQNSPLFNPDGSPKHPTGGEPF
jgi:hypothetical protein